MSKAFNHNNFESTGNIAVDMVANCVAFYRNRQRPLKTIYLNRYYWNKFDVWVRRQLTTDRADLPQRYEFDGVNIERAEVIINKPLEMAFYES